MTIIFSSFSEIFNHHHNEINILKHLIEFKISFGVKLNEKYCYTLIIILFCVRIYVLEKETETERLVIISEPL